VVVVAGPRGTREQKFAEFAKGYMAPDLAPDELLVAVRFPLWPAGHGAAFLEFARRHGDFALVSVAALIQCDGGNRISRAAVTLGGVGPVPIRVGAVEAGLAGEAGAPGLFRAVSEACRQCEALEDAYATADYRRQLAVVLTRRALEAAFARATAKAAR